LTLHFLGVDLKLGGDRLALVFSVSSSRSSLRRAIALLDRRQMIVDGGELALDVIELLVEVGDELVKGSLEVTIVGTNDSGVGSNRSARY
jgi:hypothetical protein